ncbi:MAG: hypothetical protein Q7R30_24255 [Acidobacteriota bacterium]|nr:hypothetical protein [Acidobacteriota bacterium]
MSDVDPQQMRHYAALANSTAGPLGDVYRLLSRPRMHYGGAEASCQQFLIVLELASSPEELTDVRAAIEAFEQGGWGMFAAKLRPALAAAEARLR